MVDSTFPRRLCLPRDLVTNGVEKELDQHYDNQETGRKQDNYA